MTAPYSRGVTSDYSTRPPRLDGRTLRDLLALLLLLAGVIGLLVVAFDFNWQAGTLVASALALIAGIFLGYDR